MASEVAKKILALIETVDPADTAKLDEIDAQFICWRDGAEYIGNDGHQFFWKIANGGLGKTWLSQCRYTRSRDALKAIRPKGWHYECNKICNGTFWAALHKQYPIADTGDYDGHSCEAWYAKTEELAELHAIIQALAYERGRYE